MEDKKVKLRRMAAWTVTIFATVFAVFLTLFWLLVFPITSGSAFQVIQKALSYGWPIFLADAVLCVIAFYGYTIYLHKRN
jgi:hypothetical protein